MDYGLAFSERCCYFTTLTQENLPDIIPDRNISDPLPEMMKEICYLWMSFGMNLGLYNPELKKTEKLFNYAPPTPIYKIVIDKNKTVWAG